MTQAAVLFPVWLRLSNGVALQARAPDMDTEYVQPAILQYEGPDSVFDEIKEEHFRDAILYMVTIFPLERDFPDSASYHSMLAAYDFDYRCAKRTLERYAIEVLDCNVDAIKSCFHQYSEDPSFYKEGLPHTFVSSILHQAWSGIGKTMFIRVIPTGDDHRSH